MSLRKQILQKLIAEKREMKMGEIYKQFPKNLKHSIRARVYESIGKGITKVGRGLYVSSECIIEKGNSLTLIDRMIQEGDKFDFIFLDIPYDAGGQKGGNRNLFNKDTISPDEFGEFLLKLEGLLRTEDSPLLFMFTSGRSSAAAFKRYFKKFEETSLIQAESIGTYTKLWSNGNRMNMGKYLMPKENIYVFSKSGNAELKTLHYFLTPNYKEYPSSKPYSMIKRFVLELAGKGEWVFDPFGGSGKILEACLELKRKCHIIDNCDDSVENHLLKLCV